MRRFSPKREGSFCDKLAVDVGIAVIAWLIPHARLGAVELLPKTAAGVQGNNTSEDPIVPADGRWVAFRSDATQLVDGDTNGRTDIFVNDRETGAVEPVSLSTGGAEPNDNCFDPAISGNGGFVSFSSHAPNLVAADTNAQTDMFIKDRETGAIGRVSLAWNGVQATSGSGEPILSADGPATAFISGASNLVPGDFNGNTDPFVVYLPSGEIRRVSVREDDSGGNAESYAPDLSGDRSLVVFMSCATAGNRFFKIADLDETGNVTSAITTGPLTTPALVPGLIRTLRVQIEPQKRWLKKTLPIAVSTPATDGNPRSDLVILKAQHR